MKKIKLNKKATIPTDLIAPCGMNCRLCWGFIRKKNTCPGCKRLGNSENKKEKYRSTCKVKNCENIKSGKMKYCSNDCNKFPCTRIKQLEKRYKTKYKMSMIDNLNMIKELGIRAFIKNEKKRWICPKCGLILCVHKKECVYCEYKWNE